MEFLHLTRLYNQVCVIVLFFRRFTFQGDHILENYNIANKVFSKRKITNNSDTLKSNPVGRIRT